MPAVQVCVHDDADPLCNQTAFGASIPNPGCEPMLTPPDTTMQGGTEQSRYVEVRICYRFTTLFNLSNLQLPFGWGLSIGDIWLNKTRNFTVGWYPALPTPVPPPPPSPPPSAPAPTDTPSPSPSPTGSPASRPRARRRRPLPEASRRTSPLAPNNQKSPMTGAISPTHLCRSIARSRRGTGTSATAPRIRTSPIRPHTYVNPRSRRQTPSRPGSPCRARQGTTASNERPRQSTVKNRDETRPVPGRVRAGAATLRGRAVRDHLARAWASSTSSSSRMRLGKRRGMPRSTARPRNARPLPGGTPTSAGCLTTST